MQLSISRARAVADAIKSAGIESLRISFEGKGETSPMDTNDTVEGRKNNRRTEYILKKQ